MKTFKVKIITFIILTLSFLGYSATLYLSEPYEKQPANELAQEGKIIWQQKNCTSCHQLYGLGGHLGPDLTNVYGKRPEAYIESFLRSGTNVMPNFNLSDQEIKELIEFLKYTNTTGVSNPTSFTTHLNGTITQSKD